MEKRMYEKPSMEVVVLNQQQVLLVGSGEEKKDAERPDYESTEW